MKGWVMSHETHIGGGHDSGGGVGHDNLNLIYLFYAKNPDALMTFQYPLF